MGMVYVDAVILDGVTGSLPGRRRDMAALVERKRRNDDFDVIVLQRIDRLTRSGLEHGLWFQHECNCVGLRLVFVADDIPPFEGHLTGRSIPRPACPASCSSRT